MMLKLYGCLGTSAISITPMEHKHIHIVAQAIKHGGSGGRGEKCIFNAAQMWQVLGRA